MDLILWRHAEAEDGARGSSDLKRALTAKGQQQAERMAAWLGEQVAPETRILVSPALRCQQTVRPLGRAFDTEAAIGPGSSATRLLRAAGWPDAATPVLVVGHQPTLGLVASFLLTGTEQAWSVKKAGVWWLRRETTRGVAAVVLHATQAPGDL